MRTLGWCMVALVATSLSTSAAALGPLGVLAPNVPVLVAAFSAFRRGPAATAMIAALLGHLEGRMALAPPGACAASLALVATAVFALSGQLAGGGRAFFSLAAGGAVLAWELTTWALVAALASPAPSPPWLAMLGESAGTALLAAVAYRGLLALDRRLMRDGRQGLRWR